VPFGSTSKMAYFLPAETSTRSTMDRIQSQEVIKAKVDFMQTLPLISAKLMLLCLALAKISNKLNN